MIVLKTNEIIAFDMYFASVASMQFHPGAGTKDHEQLSIQECCDIALDMVKVRRNVLSVSSMGINAQVED